MMSPNRRLPAPSQAPTANTGPARLGVAGDLDLRRIQKALRQRARYRYVRPSIERAPDGYRIVSPCCSRNIDAAGGTIDIAWLQFLPDTARWRLHSKDHRAQAWTLQSEGRLHELLALLNQDPQRVFWQ